MVILCLLNQLIVLNTAISAAFIKRACIYESIYLVDGQGEMVTKNSVWCWRSSANFEGY